MTEKHEITFADLFAGIGGMRIAFERAGGKCVLTSEIDEKAITTYLTNFPQDGGHKLVRDVNQLTADDFEMDPGDLDILVAGFPCQPYSIAGLRKGLEDDRGGEIFNSIIRLLREVKPASFLLENVKGIRSHENGETFKFMLEKLSGAGYSLRHETLNSRTHANTPQNRERVFIVGFRDPLKAEKFSFPEEIELTSSIHDCLISSNQIDEKFYYDDRYGAFAEIDTKVTKTDTIYQWRRQYVRENKSKACPTLTANMGSGGHNVPLVRDSRGVRKLTPRETANFQGFPADFRLPDIAPSHLYHQFGNSVTVPLIEKLAVGIVEALS